MDDSLGRLLFVAAIGGLIVGCGGDSPPPPVDEQPVADAAPDSRAVDGGGSDGRDGGPDVDAGGADGSDAGPDSRCEPNATLACACASGVGTQRCLPDGSRWSGCTCAHYGLELAVSPSGSDAAAGTLSAPFKTLERAQTAVRAAIGAGLPSDGLVVWLRGGSYEVTKTLSLGAGDSGSASATVTWSGYPGESVHLVGGKTIAPAAFEPVKDTSPVWSRLDPSVRGKVVVADLAALGISDYGALVPTGNDCSSGAETSALELSIDGAAMPLARWPDPDENTDVLPATTGSSLHVFGEGLTPDVSGDYVKTGVLDGVSVFARTGLVGGKQYNLHRDTWSDSTGKHVAWFLTTTATGYPTDADPWFFTYAPGFRDLDPSNGASGRPTFNDPAAIHQGFVRVKKGLSATQFQYANERPSRWRTGSDYWLHGLFKFGWAECHTQVAALDEGAKTLTVTTAPGFGIADGQPFYAENLLEEITAPGEWFLDRATGKLYVLPPASLAGKSIIVSMLKTPLVSLAGASHLTLRDIVFESGRATLVEVTNGAHIRLVGLTLRNGGFAGASLQGTDIGVSYAHVYGTAEDGVILSGGDRPSLTPGNDFVENSHIHDFARWNWMYKTAVTLTGVGNRVSHNKIHDAPHSALLFFETNDARIEFNDIYRVCRNTDDAGAIYAGRDWGARGDAITSNYIHDLSSRLGDSVSAIYLDDCLSGVEVKGNIIDRIAGLGIQHGGGRDDLMESNVLANCSRAAIDTDARCVTWAASSLPLLLSRLEAVNYQRDPWRTRYPLCAAIPDDLATISAPGARWGLPEGTVFSRNAGFANLEWLHAEDALAVPAFKELKDNLPDATKVFVDEAAGDMNIAPGSPVLSIPGFVPTPFASVGIQP